MVTHRNDDAISEVIAEVMILALVVTLGAVIAGMVFGVFNGLQPATIAAVTAVRSDGGNVTVTYHGATEQNPVYWLGISVNSTTTKTLGVYGGSAPLEVGNSTTVRAPVAGNDHIVVSGSFADGTEIVVLDTFV